MTTTRSPAVTKAHGKVALSNRARIVLAACTAVTLALYLIPDMYWVAYPLILISTVVHEMGHGVASLLVGGRWPDFHMFSDASGYASTWAPEGAARAFVLAGGLCGPAVAGAVFLALGRRPKTARWALGAVGGFFALSEILWVRGGFGWLFVGGLAAVCLVIAMEASAEVAQISLIFLATQLALSVYSRSDYLFTRGVTGQTVGASGNSVSDVEGMAQQPGHAVLVLGRAVRRVLGGGAAGRGLAVLPADARPQAAEAPAGGARLTRAAARLRRRSRASASRSGRPRSR